MSLKNCRNENKNSLWQESRFSCSCIKVSYFGTHSQNNISHTQNANVNLKKLIFFTFTQFTQARKLKYHPLLLFFFALCLYRTVNKWPVCISPHCRCEYVEKNDNKKTRIQNKCSVMDRKWNFCCCCCR